MLLALTAPRIGVPGVLGGVVSEPAGHAAGEKLPLATAEVRPAASFAAPEPVGCVAHVIPATAYVGVATEAFGAVSRKTRYPAAPVEGVQAMVRPVVVAAESASPVGTGGGV